MVCHEQFHLLDQRVAETVAPGGAAHRGDLMRIPLIEVDQKSAQFMAFWHTRADFSV